MAQRGAKHSGTRPERSLQFPSSEDVWSEVGRHTQSFLDAVLFRWIAFSLTAFFGDPLKRKPVANSLISVGEYSCVG